MAPQDQDPEIMRGRCKSIAYFVFENSLLLKRNAVFHLLDLELPTRHTYNYASVSIRMWLPPGFYSGGGHP